MVFVLAATVGVVGAWLGLAVEQVAEPLPGRGLRSANLPMVA